MLKAENLGEINNVIINEKGDVVAAIIGVGGFLGIGEKNVGVPFDALEFRAADPADSRSQNKRRKGGRKEGVDSGTLRLRARRYTYCAEHNEGRLGGRPDICVA